MRRRSGTSSEPVKARRRKAVTLKRRNAPKTVRRRSSTTAEHKSEIARLTGELSEALEQQTATSEILSVISRSNFKLQPVLQSVVNTAMRLCRAEQAVIYRQEQGTYRFAAGHSTVPDYLDIEKGTVILPGKGTVVGRAALTKRVARIDDAWNDPLYEKKRDAKIGGVRSMIGVPLLREGETIGAIALARNRVEPFTDREIELVATFADQVVIAIENVRLFEAEQQRTRELSESLEQQTATSVVLRVVSSSPGDLEPVFATMLENAVRICDAKFGNIYRWDGQSLHLMASHNVPAAFAGARARSPSRPSHETPTGRMITSKAFVHVPDLAAEPAYAARDPWIVDGVELARVRTLLVVPMLKENDLVGAFTIYRQEVRPFTDKQIDLVKNFASQAVIAIENARLLNELRESLEQQTATADVLRVISSSPSDIQPVLEAIVRTAGELCASEYAIMFRVRDGRYYPACANNAEAEWVKYFSENPISVDRGSLVGRAVLDRCSVHIIDCLADPEYKLHEAARLGKQRSMLGVPLLRDGEPIGVLGLLRTSVKPFNERQIELVTTFADQAVIAVENVRLLNELRESLQQQTATADVLKVISRSAFDLRMVLNTLLQSAARLCEADQGTITQRKGEKFYRSVSYGFPTAFAEYVKDRPVKLGRDTATGRALLEGKVIHIPDVQADADYTWNEAQRLGGFRTLLGVPMLREGVPVGVLTLTRTDVRPFTDKQIELVSTFADQAAIAIENVRLFESVEWRTRELTRSLDDLRAAQDRLVQTEKLASLGQLTAGIAHEIKNPLNFVNNFSAVSVELIDELREALGGVHLDDKARAEIGEIADLLQSNLDKIVQHGKRADSIVKNMLLHSRQGSGEHRPVDINALVDESLNLAYHGARAEKQGFNITLERLFDPAAGEVDLFPQEITRVLLNLISNGFYAATKRKAETNGGDYEPTVTATTKSLGDSVEIRIRDNGTGIPPEVKEKLFNPFFTTKPAGEGTGLGLSISHDIIVKQHGGSIEVDTQPGEFTEFRVILPRRAATIAKSGER